MSDVALNPILDRVFRSNPAYELLPFGRLPPDQQELLSNLTKDPDFYGVLRPRAIGVGSVKSVCRDTALLVHTLLQPGPLPHYLRQTSDEHSNQAIAELVLDGVLEIGHEGRFVSGPDAYGIVYASHAPRECKGLLPRLSQAALEYGQALVIDDTVRLSERLYFYNRIPLTPHWTRRLPSADAVAEFLGLSDPTVRERLRKKWSSVEPFAPHRGWFQWRSRFANQDGGYGYKLYISPRPDAMPDVFRAVVETLDESAADHFKVGCDPVGLLRPDKLIVYFGDFEPLRRVAHDLTLRLSGCPAQGVPFTAAIGDDGLLSWGVDPLPEKGALAWQGPESWRLWVTNRLAAALVAARNNLPGTLQPWQFALERLRLENVDTATWTPAFSNAVPV